MLEFQTSDLVHQLAHARAFMVQHVIAALKNPVRGEAWLEALDASHRGRLLMLNLAFDAQVKALSLDTCAAVLDCLPPPTGDACIEFAVARTAFERDHFRQHSSLEGYAKISSHGEGEGYVRVLEVGNFTQYYDSPRSGRGLSAEDIGEVRKLYFGNDASEDFGDITQVWTGKNNRVWVLPRTDFVALVKQPALVVTQDSGDSFRGRDIRDALGLPILSGNGLHGEPDLVAVHYPPKCDGLQARQPTSLDADWESPHVFYISYGLVDGWGRTYSLSNQGDGCRERVHGPFQPLTREFFGEYIGEATTLSISEADHGHVVAAAAKRYSHFVTSNASEARV